MKQWNEIMVQCKWAIAAAGLLTLLSLPSRAEVSFKADRQQGGRSPTLFYCGDFDEFDHGYTLCKVGSTVYATSSDAENAPPISLSAVSAFVGSQDFYNVVCFVDCPAGTYPGCIPAWYYTATGVNVSAVPNPGGTGYLSKTCYTGGTYYEGCSPCIPDPT